MIGIDGPLACLECGQPAADGLGWLCSTRCAAVMRLVRYGRNHADSAGGDDVLDDSLMNRYRREAGVVGHFPTGDVLADLGLFKGRACYFPGCPEREALFVDWRDDDPDLSRAARADDLRLLCADHHRSEALRRFIGPLGQSARTAPAIWARMTAAAPIVLRDNEALWRSKRNVSILRDWPLASTETRRDLERWQEALQRGRSATRKGAATTGSRSDGAVETVVDQWNRELDGLDLPPRRRARLVRAIHAWLLMTGADESGLGTVREGIHHA